MDDTRTDPHDDLVTSVPLPTNVGEGADKVIAQQNQNPEVAAGGGEWPSPGTAPTGPSPGSAGESPDRSAPDGGTGPERHPESPASGDEEGTFPPFKDALNADPVNGGSNAVGDDDEDPGSKLQGASRLPGPDIAGG